MDEYAGCCSVSRNRCSEVEPSIVNGRSFASHKSRSMPPTLIWKSALSTSLLASSRHIGIWSRRARQSAVTEDSVGWAREQLAINQRLMKAGTLAPVELAAAEAELQRRMDTWYTSLGALTEVENNLKTLIAPERVGLYLE